MIAVQRMMQSQLQAKERRDDHSTAAQGCGRHHRHRLGPRFRLGLHIETPGRHHASGASVNYGPTELANWDAPAYKHG
jgi:hypothetical protein